MWNIAVKGINEVGRWGRRGERFDSAKVGFCLRRGAAALQDWDFARGGEQKARFAGGRIGLFRGNEVERWDERDAAHGVCFSGEGGKAEAIGGWCAARERIS